MQLDLTYLPAEDRMRLSLRGSVDLLLTRKILLGWVSAWLLKLEQIDLPDVGIALGERDIGQEHALSLEFDAPQAMHQTPSPSSTVHLLQEVTLTVHPLGTHLILRGQGLETNFALTRKESHLLLEMLGQKARAARWLEAIDWPTWLATAG